MHYLFKWIKEVHIFIFQVEELVLWIELPRPENPPITMTSWFGITYELVAQL